jgi:hypothetical protein
MACSIGEDADDFGAVYGLAVQTLDWLAECSLGGFGVFSSEGGGDEGGDDAAPMVSGMD